ncbi:unnamed protein product, partial [Choristocarpus tenellus]
KLQLAVHFQELKEDFKNFRTEWETSGPMVEGISPLEGVERLRRFKEELQSEIYADGEELFALRSTQHPELSKTKKEVGLLEQLYTLYMDVVDTLERYSDILWSGVEEELESMVDMIASFDTRCKKMPKKLRGRDLYMNSPTYHVIWKKISDFQDVLPLIQNLHKASIKPRHWHEVILITKTQFPFEREGFKLANILDSPILDFKEDVEEICEGADKQLSIEEKLSDIKDQWDTTSLDFVPWKNRGVSVLRVRKRTGID